jgi:peptidoglycan/LPS O-acetylase OafA/YrhL
MSEPPSQQRLRRLECLRGAAACYVVAHHYVHVVLAPHGSWLPRLFKFGQLAVLVFFVVSGFVIYYAALGREFTVRDYLIRRFRRIYPPFLLALLITWVVQCAIEGGLADPAPRELLGNLLMLQDENTHSWVQPYLANSPLWSLSYEWAFYLLFIPLYLLLRAHRHRQLALVGGGAVLAFGVHQLVPTQITLFLMYLPIWWAGVELAREHVETGQVSVRRQLVPLALVMAMAALWAIPVMRARAAGVELIMWKHPVIELRHFVTASVILVGAQVWRIMKWWGFDLLLGGFERLAPISYGLYIVHKPIMQLAADRSPLGDPWLDLVWVIPLVLALAWVIERRIQRHVVRWLPTQSERSRT